jgi:hypothetical protein
MKWVALGLLLLCLFNIVVGYKMDKTASFESGSFLLEIALVVSGGVGVLAGSVMFGLLVFQRL